MFCVKLGNQSAILKGSCLLQTHIYIDINMPNMWSADNTDHPLHTCTHRAPFISMTLIRKITELVSGQGEIINLTKNGFSIWDFGGGRGHLFHFWGEAWPSPTPFQYLFSLETLDLVFPKHWWYLWLWDEEGTVNFRPSYPNPALLSVSCCGGGVWDRGVSLMAAVTIGKSTVCEFPKSSPWRWRWLYL